MDTVQFEFLEILEDRGNTVDNTDEYLVKWRPSILDLNVPADLRIVNAYWKDIQSIHMATHNAVSNKILVVWKNTWIPRCNFSDQHALRSFGVS